MNSSNLSQTELLAFGYLSLVQSPYLADVEYASRNMQLAELFLRFVVGGWLVAFPDSDSCEVVSRVSNGIAHAQCMDPLAASELAQRYSAWSMSEAV
jgi:AmiR/NasT family two-component response regulator